jgi:hypothetical protein
VSAVRGTTTAKTTTTGDTTLALPKPSGLASGDFCTVPVLVINNTTQGAWEDIGLPTGAFLLGEANSDNYSKLFLCGLIATGSEGSTIDFTYEDPAGAGDTFSIQGIFNARSGHDSVPLDHTVIETGTATGGSTTTLVKTSAGWTTNQHAGRILRNVTTGKYGYIASNTSDTLTIRHAMASANANTNSFEILSVVCSVQWQSAFGTSTVAPSVTTIASATHLMSVYAGGDGEQSSFGDNLTAPGGQLERAEVEIDSRGGWGRLMLADESIGVSGATGPRAASHVTNWQGFSASLALREPASGGGVGGAAYYSRLLSR